MPATTSTSIPSRRAASAATCEAPEPACSISTAWKSQFVELRRNREFKRGRKGSGAGYGKQMPRAQVLEARTALVAALEEFQVRPTPIWRRSCTWS